MKSSNSKFAQKSLYMLKRRYGSPGALYHIISASDNYETGNSIVTKIKYSINRIILLPTTLVREMSTQVGFRVHDYNMALSGIDGVIKLIIIDRHDLPVEFELNSSDYIVVHEEKYRNESFGKRYNIQKVQILEDNLSYLFTTRFMADGTRNEWHDMKINEPIVLAESLIPHIYHY